MAELVILITLLALRKPLNKMILTGVPPQQANAVLKVYRQELRNSLLENVLLDFPMAILLTISTQIAALQIFHNIIILSAYSLISLGVIIGLIVSSVTQLGRWYTGILAGYVDDYSNDVYTNSFLFSKGAVIQTEELVKTKEYNRLILGWERRVIEYIRPSDARKFYLIESMFGSRLVTELSKSTSV